MISILGIILIPLAAYGLSTNRLAINPRTVFGAFIIQASFGFLVLYVPLGKQLLASLADSIASMLSYTKAGTSFLFGRLVDQDMGFIFALNALPIIVFFSALVAVLYHLGIMSRIIRAIGGSLKALIKTSHAESMSAAANIFIGQTEAPLVVRPYLAGMTKSELFAVMVGGLASIAGSVMAGYAALGIELKYLLAACFMAAPGGLMMAKIILPETEQPQSEFDESGDIKGEKYFNIFDAAASGALTGLQMALAVGAMLLAFISLIALLNGILGWAGDSVGINGLTIELLLGYLFQPVAFLLGIPWSEANIAGGLIGQKLVLNEFVAYVSFLASAPELSEQSQAIVIFALCGFANFSSIAILLGGIGALAPNRREDISRLGLRALVAATLANLMSASLAGFFLALS
ncbi:MAG: NupC/NupG family nucleoside CNT transporter [Gammaproteobacteria bacterium]|nr:NupC/NupG family nucleoside CNT transporter [Gammaproteobacteria bacterium]MBT5202292.1 NupC/NupG family nucleoside CNT transporter [Gammaproteobacteria bacterium]MBT5601942.1 NupC/NupG family nucleoside CNT transporter [Gammaproteobacteria bacterium]MBT6245789.1 NupC/NupG family nucleoside CNT transporter [Gammaproteobacteria bacterium]